MIELLFLACLSASPASCEERSLLYTDVTPMTCMLGAQPELARWAESNPRWIVGRWKCRYVNIAEQDV
jgi:hypothetical protein